MARPLKKRTICLKLASGYFRPQAAPDPALPEVVLEVDEIEAVRLADAEGRYQEEAARLMGISRATFSTIIHRARRKIAAALIGGKAIRINCPRMARRAAAGP